jgi:hypothetical protein
MKVEQPEQLILLPGFQIQAEDFTRQGFVALVQENAPMMDVLVVEPSLDLYLDGSIGRVLNDFIARAQRGRRVWLGAISLGCFGALLAAMEPDRAFDGAILLSPFVATPGLIAEIVQAGGLASWNPGWVASNDSERRLLTWLKSGGIAASDQGSFHLGYGRSDRFAPASILLGSCLPADRVLIIDGAHDWLTWRELWQKILASNPFGRCAATTGQKTIDTL